MGWVVGDGTSIKIWYSPWLSLTEKEGPMGPAREADMNLTVSDLFLQGSNEWDEEKLQNMLPHLKEKIKAIKPSLSGAPDKRAWLGTTTGEYTNKSGYKVWLTLCGKKCLPPTGLAAEPLAPWIMWQLWISRNSLCFLDKHITEEETIIRALKMAKEWTDAQEKKATPQQKKYLREPFPQNCYVLRGDAAWRASSQQAGFGWTIKRQDVDVASFSTGSSVGSALTAEAVAMRQAIQEARILGHKRLVCEADSLQLVKALSGGEGCAPEVKVDIAEMHRRCYEPETEVLRTRDGGGGRCGSEQGDLRRGHEEAEARRRGSTQRSKTAELRRLV
ncbi:hypothetical protein F2Q69_00060394 [Brassica cretica]|uniref:RNase H type-1 domain-containing protein n=2 Tax=Brassica cretica TaxID=69181 RepID=A0A8S9RPM0_BRACR|nr:hypothetical protein F2Q69_00060394 [Brassica cretica]